MSRYIISEESLCLRAHTRKEDGKERCEMLHGLQGAWCGVLPLEVAGPGVGGLRTH